MRTRRVVDERHNANFKVILAVQLISRIRSAAHDVGAEIHLECIPLARRAVAGFVYPADLCRTSEGPQAARCV